MDFLLALALKLLHFYFSHSMKGKNICKFRFSRSMFFLNKTLKYGDAPKYVRLQTSKGFLCMACGLDCGVFCTKLLEDNTTHRYDVEVFS